MGLYEIISPSADRNVILNPSVEVNTTGWAAQGTNTIVQDETESWRGNYSAKCTYQNNAVLARIVSGTGTETMNPNQKYYAIARVWVPSDWNGGDINIDFNGFSGATLETIVDEWVSGTSPNGVWIRLVTHVTLASDVVGNIDILTSSNPTAGRFVYIDGWALFESDDQKTYTDGDDVDSRWVGARHASASLRNARMRMGGTLKDLDDLGFYVQTVIGLGRASKRLLGEPWANTPGSRFTKIRINDRPVSLVGFHKGTSLSNLHSLRDDLFAIMDPDTEPPNDRFVLRYKGANGNVPVELPVSFVQEASGAITNDAVHGFVQRNGLSLLAHSPMWRGLNDGSAILDGLVDVTNTNYVIRRDEFGAWGNMDQGVSGASVLTLDKTIDGKIALGGNFDTAGSGALTVNNITLYDPNSETYEALGSGTVGVTSAGAEWVSVIRIAPNGDIYVGGNFDNAGGSTANNIAYYDISAGTWQVLNDGGNIGTNGEVIDMVFDSDGDLFICGNFTTAGAASANRIAKWDGTNFAALSTGLNQIGYSIAMFGSDVVVGGAFTTAGGVSCGRIAVWHTVNSTWEALGEGFNAIVYDILPTSSGIIVCGNFTTLNTSGATMSFVSRWTGSVPFAQGAWVQLDNGLNAITRTIEQLDDGSILFGGNFQAQAGGGGPLPPFTLQGGLVLWTGTEFLPFTLAPPTTASADVFAIVQGEDGSLYLGFSTSGTAEAEANELVINNGSAAVHPIIKIENPTAAPHQIFSIINVTTGRALYFNNLKIPPGAKFELNLTPGERSFTDLHVLVLGRIYENLMSHVAPGSDLGSFRLEPGNNYINVNTEENTLEIKMRWRETFKSVDGVA